MVFLTCLIFSRLSFLIHSFKNSILNKSITPRGFLEHKEAHLGSINFFQTLKRISESVITNFYNECLVFIHTLDFPLIIM